MAVKLDSFRKERDNEYSIVLETAFTYNRHHFLATDEVDAIKKVYAVVDRLEEIMKWFWICASAALSIVVLSVAGCTVATHDPAPNFDQRVQQCMRDHRVAYYVGPGSNSSGPVFTCK